MGTVERRGGSARFQVQYRVDDRVYAGDLVFRDGQPTLVVSWRTLEWKRVPYICVVLDSAKLKPVASNPGTYVYEGDLTCPSHAPGPVAKP